MAMRGREVHKNHNPTLYITELSPLNHFFFIMVAYPGHILESTKGIEIKHTLMLMRGNTEDKNNNPVLHFT